MKYLLLICRDESHELSPDERADEDSSTQAWVDEMDGRGVRRFGEGLRPVSDATTVRVREGDVLVADGPFAETKEQIAPRRPALTGRNCPWPSGPASATPRLPSSPPPGTPCPSRN
jgi:hypothetical protein